jgi:hypothetical protein
MSDSEETQLPTPVIVEYDPVTGVPAEFNEFLPKDCEEYKRWKAAQAGPEALAALTLKDKDGNEIEKQLPGGKVKKKQKAQVRHCFCCCALLAVGMLILHCMQFTYTYLDVLMS